MDPINKSRTDRDPATEKPPTNQISIAPRAVRFEEFICDWMVKALGLIAAILFGIWAPLSYKATRDGDGSNAAAQASLMSAISAVSSIQSSAASKQSNALSEIAAQYSAMGKLQAVRYCETYTVSKNRVVFTVSPLQLSNDFMSGPPLLLVLERN